MKKDHVKRETGGESRNETKAEWRARKALRASQHPSILAALCDAQCVRRETYTEVGIKG